jgi:4-hydroxy-tetrahydrodipicolinate reductase
MGREVVKAVHREVNLQLVGGVDIYSVGEDLGKLAGIGELGLTIQPNLAEALKICKPQVLVDFTQPESVGENIKLAIEHGVRPVVGTTGLNEGVIQEIKALCERKSIGCLIAPNFAIGAVLMIKLAVQVAKYMPNVEIIELHHDQKLDAPSGTALKTAQAIAQVRESFRQGHFNEEEKISGARGGDYEGMRIHSIRLPGYIAHQEVIFGGLGQTLTIRHDSISRESFMPGVIMGINRIIQASELIQGLENILD